MVNRPPKDWYELHVQVPRSLIQQVREAAERVDLNPSQFIRAAIREKLSAEVTST